MKNFAALTIAAIAFTFTFAPVTHAQTAGKHYIGTLSGTPVRVLASSTNTVAIGLTSTNIYGLPGSTNQLLVQSVSEFDFVGFTWSYLSGSNATVQVFKSYDNLATFDAIPSYSFSGPATSSGAFSTNAVLDCTGVTHLAFVVLNPSTIDETNAYLSVYLKSPKRGAKQATE
jgi:hypothetical protein